MRAPVAMGTALSTENLTPEAATVAVSAVSSTADRSISSGRSGGGVAALDHHRRHHHRHTTTTTTTTTTAAAGANNDIDDDDAHRSSIDPSPPLLAESSLASSPSSFHRQGSTASAIAGETAARVVGSMDPPLDGEGRRRVGGGAGLSPPGRSIIGGRRGGSAVGGNDGGFGNGMQRVDSYSLFRGSSSDSLRGLVSGAASRVLASLPAEIDAASSNANNNNINGEGGEVTTTTMPLTPPPDADVVVDSYATPSSPLQQPPSYVAASVVMGDPDPQQQQQQPPPRGVVQPRIVQGRLSTDRRQTRRSSDSGRHLFSWDEGPIDGDENGVDDEANDNEEESSHSSNRSRGNRQQGRGGRQSSFLEGIHETTVFDDEDNDDGADAFHDAGNHGGLSSDWMGRSVPALVHGHRSVAPMLPPPLPPAEGNDEDEAEEAATTAEPQEGINEDGDRSYGWSSRARQTGAAANLAGNSLLRRTAAGLTSSTIPPQPPSLAPRTSTPTAAAAAADGPLAARMLMRRFSTGSSSEDDWYSDLPPQWRGGSGSEYADGGGGGAPAPPRVVGGYGRISNGGAQHHGRRAGSVGANGRGGVRGGTGMRTGGPNVALSLMAREATGKTRMRSRPHAARLLATGGCALYDALDKPSGGIPTEVASLESALNDQITHRGSFEEVSAIVSRLAPRIVGDWQNPPPPAVAARGTTGRSDNGQNNGGTNDLAFRHAGGGRVGMERDAFVLSGGVPLLLRLFREPRFVGVDVGRTNDARDISSSLVSTRLAGCWNEALAMLRELAYSIPSLVDEGVLLEDGDLVPFLFTLLGHGPCFDAAAALIEEILSLQTAPPSSSSTPSVELNDDGAAAGAGDGCGGGGGGYAAVPRASSTSTFFLGNIPNLYDLWGKFSCRQLAHFCRIIALLVFEPEDRQLMESPAVLKSIELLQLRRDRAARAGQDAAVDMNQAILLGDEGIVMKLLQLLRVMNYSPDLGRASPYQVISHFPWIADTLVMLGFTEIEDWASIDRLDALARQMNAGQDAQPDGRTRQRPVGGPGALSGSSGEDDEEPSSRSRHPSELGSVATMLENLSDPLFGTSAGDMTYLGHLIHVINAAQEAGVVLGRHIPSAQVRASTVEVAESVDENRESSRSLERQDENTGNSSTESGVDNDNIRSGIPTAHVTAIPVDDASVGDAATLSVGRNGQVIFQRMYPGTGANSSVGGFGDGGSYAAVEGAVVIEEAEAGNDAIDGPRGAGTNERHRISNPTDAANEMQFNALLLAPFQVEVLFVLCTLLGGRRKIDAQRLLARFGVVSILDEMFDRLSWGRSSGRRSPASRHLARSTSISEGTDAGGGQGREHEHSGIHGPGCECDPESALRVQYLRLLHNFCDRDCENYTFRRLLLSPSERKFIFDPPNDVEREHLQGGLLSKIISAYVNEPDDSPYKFWLASCAESFLRGSSQNEQVFVAESGLLVHLINTVLSDRLHCAGSLQTAFDLLGEMCKGNPRVLHMFLGHLDENRFRRFMGVAVENLVDSNVFMRSLLLSTEKILALKQQMWQSRKQTVDSAQRNWSRSGLNDEQFSHENPKDMKNKSAYGGMHESTIPFRGYLTHSWWDMLSFGISYDDIQNQGSRYLDHGAVLPQVDMPAKAQSQDETARSGVGSCMWSEYERIDEGNGSDWFLPMSFVQTESGNISDGTSKSAYCSGHTHLEVLHPAHLTKPGRMAWAFAPQEMIPFSTIEIDDGFIESVNGVASEYNFIDRLAWFLTANQSQLLRELLAVVNLRNINHENICCLNTVVVLAIFAHRRKHLSEVLGDLRLLSRADLDKQKCNQSRQSSRSLKDGSDLEGNNIRINRITAEESSCSFECGRSALFCDNDDHVNILENLRGLLWFWLEYYTQRGRDRLSLEFSSHLRFHELKHVVSLMCADDGSSPSVTSRPISLPTSPYRRPPRTVESRAWDY